MVLISKSLPVFSLLLLMISLHIPREANDKDNVKERIELQGQTLEWQW